MLRRSTPLWWLVGCLLLAAPLRQGRASYAPQVSLVQLVARSDATVLGHTLALHSFWQGSRILTKATVAVDELWSGSLAGANTVEVVTLGGAVGEWGQRVEGAAELSEYGRMVLHLQRTQSEYTPTSMAAGVWQVDGLWGDGAKVRHQLASGRTKTHLLAPTFASRQPSTLAALRLAVSEAAAAAAKQP